MELKSPVGLYITTYEISEGKHNPTLSHIFWGDDLKTAIDIAKSHMISDAFFSSSFVGQMPWKDMILYLSNDGKVLGHGNIGNIMEDLHKNADAIVRKQYEKGMIKTVQVLSYEKK